MINPFSLLSFFNEERFESFWYTSGYAKKYEGSGKKVHLAAFAFLGRDDIEMTVEIL